MKYYSTNHQAPTATLHEAVVKGLAGDRGLYMPERIEKLWQAFFPSVEMPDAVRSLRMLTPGDFNAAYGTLRFYDKSELTADIILDALKSEIAYKDGREGRTMGL